MPVVSGASQSHTQKSALPVSQVSLNQSNYWSRWAIPGPWTPPLGLASPLGAGDVTSSFFGQRSWWEIRAHGQECYEAVALCCALHWVQILAMSLSRDVALGKPLNSASHCVRILSGHTCERGVTVRKQDPGQREERGLGGNVCTMQLRKFGVSKVAVRGVLYVLQAGRPHAC
jgi:hypothetical protein